MNLIFSIVMLFVIYKTFKYGNVVGNQQNKKGKYAIWMLAFLLLLLWGYLFFIKKTFFQ